jgi:hypothetical protein
MGYALSLTQSQCLTALRAVMLAALPAIEVVQGEDNQIPEPLNPDFVIFTPILRSRISTNVDTYSDAAFTGSIAGTVLTVATMTLGAINPSVTPLLFGSGVSAGTYITAQTGGTARGVGTYTVSKSQSLTSTSPLACGVVGMRQPTQLTVQVDAHGPGSADNIETISTVMRSMYGADLFYTQGYDVVPLYCSDPRQTPFQNAENQIERQWSCDIVLQANQTVSAPQQFMTNAVITIEPPVDANAVVISSTIPAGAIIWNGGQLLWNGGNLAWT